MTYVKTHEIFSHFNLFFLVFFFSFNAVVSKTVNKHGDHAFSVTGHARHFYPIGHGIKINHYFPNKDQNKEDKNENTDIEAKPVVEDETPKSEPQIMMIDGNKFMVLKPIELDQPKEVGPSTVVEPKPVQVMPAVVKMIMQSRDDAVDGKLLVKQVPAEENETLKQIVKEESEKVPEKEEPSSDSEVASSYYHSKVYYIGY